MRGKAYSDTNRVVWENGKVSLFPDWPTARECGSAARMLHVLKGVRAFLFDIEDWVRPDDPINFDTIMKDVIATVNEAGGMTESHDTSERPVADVTQILREQAADNYQQFGLCPPPPGLKK